MRSITSVGAVRRLLTGAITRPEELSQLSADELDLVLRLARRVKLLGCLAVRLDEIDALEGLPAAAVEQLASALVVADSRARLARWELNRIDWALREMSGTQVIVLKGCAYVLAEMPNAAGRVFADVDLLVAESDLESVESALVRHRWKNKELSPYDDNFYRAWAHELPALVHEEREVEVDVHHNLLGRFAPFKPDSASLLRAAEALPGSRFQTLCDTDRVLHAMAHLMYGGDLADGLRDLVDIDLMLQSFAADDGAFWERLIGRSDQLDLQLPLFYSVRYAARLLDTPVPQAALTLISNHAPSPLVVWLMDRLVPLALFPQHPDAPSARAGFARWLLFVRSHWVTMPPVMLVRHLTYKFYVRYLQGRIAT